MPDRFLYLLYMYLLVGTPNFISAQVVTVSPASQELAAELTTDVVVTFASPVNSASIDSLDIFIFGRWSGVMKGTLQFENNETVMRFVPEGSFMAGEWVTVSLSKNIAFVSGALLGKGYTWNFWTKAAPGTFDFQLIDDISTRGGQSKLVRSYGAYAGDFDRDGYSDLMIPNEVSHDVRVFLNDQAGGYSTFTTYPIPNGSIPSTNEGSDFNRDGWIDFAVGNTGNDLISVWNGSAGGAFSHVENVQADMNIRGLCILDLNGDAIMDIVTANRTGSDDDGNISLLLNDGAGVFSSVSNMETNSAGETACATIDANGDGILDVFVGAFGANEVLLFLGDGEGGLNFSDKKPTGINPWMLAAGDVNGDGFADVVSANSQSGNVSVILGNGNGTLRDASNHSVGQFPLAIDLGDLDGDGDLDLVTSNFSSNDYTVLENENDGSFSTRLTLPATTAASCTILHDRDNDGDLDITGIDELADRIFLFDNVTAGTAIEDDIHDGFSTMLSVYPNPFNNEVHFMYNASVSEELQATIYNQIGQQVKAIVMPVERGRNDFIWEGKNDEGREVVPGVYFIVLQFEAHGFFRQIVKI